MKTLESTVDPRSNPQSPTVPIHGQTNGALPPDWSEFGLSDASLDWQEQGLCAQTDPEAFFPEPGANATQAKRTCMRCEVRGECLAYALANAVPCGVWGGLSEQEREDLLNGKPVPEPPPAPTTRVCKTCQVEKPLTEYHADRSGSERASGLRGRCYKTSCKACVKRKRRPRVVAVRIVTPGRRVCTRCEGEKALGDFYESQGGSWCIECRREDRRDRYAARRDGAA